MFDPNRPYCLTGKGDRQFWQQDGICYDPATKEPVDVTAIKTKPTAPAPTASPLVCKLCGARRESAEAFREHLIAAHPEDAPELAPPSAEKSAPSAEKSEPGSKSERDLPQETPTQMTTENIMNKPPAKPGKGRKGK
jgi:hypothetical protein